MKHVVVRKQMIFCGQEEPLCANRHVPVYDDDRHRYLPSDMTMHRLVRYSFVWQDKMCIRDRRHIYQSMYVPWDYLGNYLYIMQDLSLIHI